METKNRILEDMKTAMKSGDTLRKSVTRMLLSELKYAQTAVDAKVELDEANAQKVVASYLKRLAKSLEDYPEGEQKVAIKAEIKIVEEYLPKSASDEDIDRVIEELVAKQPGETFGVLMKGVLAKLGSSTNGKVVSEKLKARLAKQ